MTNVFKSRKSLIVIFCLMSPLKNTKTQNIAPDNVSKINTVAIAVKYKVNHSAKEVVTLFPNVKITDPRQTWLFTFNYSESDNQSTKSDGEDISDVTTASANVSMTIDASPPDKGLVSINTSEGDHILSYSAMGNYARKRIRISRDINGRLSEKSIRDDNGSPDSFRSGLEFTYDPSPGGTKGITAAGLNFDLTGTHKLWRTDPDHPGQPKETTDNEDRKNGANIVLGGPDDIVKKIKNGFSIDYKKAKDTTYSSDHGVKHTISFSEEYHAEITRVNKK